MDYRETEEQIDNLLLSGHRKNVAKFFLFVGSVFAGFGVFVFVLDRLQNQIFGYLK